MSTRITRQALYEAVWAQPISKLSNSFGVSDVGLAKACRRLAVPLPPRGYWARRAAGKPAVQMALPPRPPGLNDETTIGGNGHRWSWSNPPDEEFLGAIPPAPYFVEPIEDVRARIEMMIGTKAIIQRDLDQPHPVVAKLLRQDDERRAKSAGRTYVASWERVLYETPLQQRRLRLVSNIMMAAARCDCRGDLGERPEMGHPQDGFTVIVGDQRVSFRVAPTETKTAVRGKTADQKAATALEVKVGSRVWENVHVSDAATIREIAIALILRGEEAHRERALSSHAWWLGRREEIIKRRKKEAEEAVRRERERLAELERKQVARLLAEAEALRNAQAIRAYVQEVKAASPRISPGELDAWVERALAQANRIDPVLNGAFLEGSIDG